MGLSCRALHIEQTTDRRQTPFGLRGPLYSKYMCESKNWSKITNSFSVVPSYLPEPILAHFEQATICQFYLLNSQYMSRLANALMHRLNRKEIRDLSRQRSAARGLDLLLRWQLYHVFTLIHFTRFRSSNLTQIFNESVYSFFTNNVKWKLTFFTES